MCISVESFVDWIDNKNKTWEVDIYFMFVHLITLDKYLIVRTVGVRENRRQLFAKCVLKVMVTKYTNACHDDHICAGPKEEIDGDIHDVQSIWDTKSSFRKLDFSTCRRKKAFNKINCIGILWTVHHLWTSGAILKNHYHHWSQLILQNGNETANLLHIREGMTQEYPLDMLAYGIGVLQLIKQPKAEYPDVTQPCYTGNMGALGMYINTKLYFNSLKQSGPGCGY